MENHFAQMSQQVVINDKYSGDEDLNMCLDSLEISDSESLSEEIKYQSGLQHWILHNEDLVQQTSEGSLDGKSVSDARKESNGEEDVRRTNGIPNEIPIKLDKTSYQHIDGSYSHLRYDPHWKKYQSSGKSELSYQDLDDLLDESSDSSVYHSQDEIPPKTSTQQPKKERIVVNNRNVFSAEELEAPSEVAGGHNLSATMKQSDGKHELCNKRDKDAVSKNKSKLLQPPNSKKDFIEKNKLTLGSRRAKQTSYLKIHKNISYEVTALKDCQNQCIQSNNLESEENSKMANVKFLSVKQNLCLPEKELSVGIKHLTVRPEICEEQQQQHKSVTEMRYPSYNPSHFKHLNTQEQENNLQNKILFPYEPLPVESLTSAHSTHCPKKNGESSSKPLRNNFTSENLHRNYNFQNYPSKHERSSNCNTKGTNPEINYKSGTDSRQSHRGLQNLSESSLPFQVNSNINNSLVTADRFLLLQNAVSEENGYSASAPQPDPRSRNEPVLTRSHSEDSLPQTKNNGQTQEKHKKMVISFLKQEVKLGGIGPYYQVSKEKEQLLKQQKEYAKAVLERNRNTIPSKVPEIPISRNDTKEAKRQKSLEYAKNVPKPKPQHLLKSSTDQKMKEESEKRPVIYDKFLPQIQKLQELQIRHEKEKVAVAALHALHML